MNFSRQRLWLFGAIALAAIVILTLFAAPANNKLSSGSSYNRAPDGYGAWYAFMEKRGTPVLRWRKPFEDLTNDKTAKPPTTFLRVNGSLTGYFPDSQEQDWVNKGNTLVVLGVRQAVTKAPFSTLHETVAGNIKINTQRRNKDAKEQLLSDRFGAIVWQETIGKGQVIYATTPHLAANAYQDFPGNYEFLAQLVTRSPDVGASHDSPVQESEASAIPNAIWVDEYIHGYKDKEVIKREQKETIFSYLAKTPVFPAVVQGLILLFVAIWAGNRRFGKAVTIPVPEINNSEAYIQALAGVLQKAESSEFILEVVGKQERLQLQKALFLGQEQLDHQSIVSAWVQQTGRPAAELEQVLQIQAQKRQTSETGLLSWLRKWQEIRPPSLVLVRSELVGVSLE